MSYTSVKCVECGVAVWMLQQTKDDLIRSRRDFYCVFGHVQVFAIARSVSDQLQAMRLERDRLKQNEAKLRDDVEDAKRATERQRARADQNLRSARAFKGAATRVRTRVAGGVCPCCNRTFAALTEHMKKQHPDYPRAPLVKNGDETHG